MFGAFLTNSGPIPSETLKDSFIRFVAQSSLTTLASAGARLLNLDFISEEVWRRQAYSESFSQKITAVRQIGLYVPPPQVPKMERGVYDAI